MVSLQMYCVCSQCTYSAIICLIRCGIVSTVTCYVGGQFQTLQYKRLKYPFLFRIIVINKCTFRKHTYLTLYSLLVSLQCRHNLIIFSTFLYCSEILTDKVNVDAYLFLLLMKSFNILQIRKSWKLRCMILYHVTVNTKYTYSYGKLPMFKGSYFDMHFVFSYLMTKARFIFCVYFLSYFMSLLHYTVILNTPFSHHSSSSGKQCFHLLSICKN